MLPVLRLEVHRKTSRFFREVIILFRHRREAGAPVAMPGREEPADAALHVRVISARDIKARARRRPHPPRIPPPVSASSRPPPVSAPPMLTRTSPLRLFHRCLA